MLVAVGSFTVAAALVVLLPGPDTLVVLRGLVRGGRRAGARTAAGVLTGLCVWVGAAALGLSAVLRASHDGYLALRVAGGAYLIWLGIQSWRAREAVRPVETRTVPAGYLAGLLTDLLNPKVGVFFITFLPGFLPSGAPVGLMSLLFGAVFVVLTAAYFAVLLCGAGRVQAILEARKSRRRVERATGAVLLGFGVRLLIE